MRQYLYILFFLLSSCSSSDPKAIFEDRTGLSISDSISNVKATDNYELLEGEFSIVFKTTQSQINSWLKGSPPWNNLKWHKGKIPPEIGVAAQFNFPERVGLEASDDGEATYFGDENLIKLLNDTTNYYSYVEDCCAAEKDLRFHDGRLLILQPHTKMIYYAVWNF
ncbi:hypothetical protein SAMN04488511_12419 [Pedobacter suwonensis]|uniref:Uncharacterized protein n=1 Tax=Pedobacter suwonensis TaxID=332999 RepID=A0A1I0U9J7_9SPHI|nr:hypothetical protein [Pedobacter suwonensis]SFA59886.1 hypothetical protein SAMN04488511_12419 [Pedobacter suwonensis]